MQRLWLQRQHKWWQAATAPPPPPITITCATFPKPWIRTDGAFKKSFGLYFPQCPSRGGENSECVNPTREGKDFVYSPHQRGKRLCVQAPPKGEKTLCVQSQDISNPVHLLPPFFAWVCLWVCEFLYEQDNSKTDFDEIFRICLKR